MSKREYSRQMVLKQLEQVQAELSQLHVMLGTFDPHLPPEEISVQWLRAMLRARRRREALFDPGIFADPAWDILLELYAMRLAGERTIVSELCKAAAVPSTTALRWIHQMESAGLVRRVRDSDDRRRIFVDLSERAVAALEEYFRGPEIAGV